MKKNINKIINFLSVRPEVIFVLIAIPFGLFSAIFVPQMSVTDENSHLLRTYQVFKLELVCKGKSTYPQDIIEKSISGNNGVRQYTADYSNPLEKEEYEFRCGSAANYSPIGYMPQAMGATLSLLFKPSAASVVLFARIANLLVYIIGIYIIIKYVRVGKYVFFVVALIPQMIHLAASLSADTMNNIITMAIVAFTINLFTQKYKVNRKQITLLIALAVSAALLKSYLILLFMPLVFLPSKIFKNNKNKKIPFNIQKWIIGLLAVIIFIGTYYAWGQLIATNSPDSSVYNPVANEPRLFINLLFNTYFSDYGDVVVRGMFGDFSSFLYHFPTILIIFQVLILYLSYLYTPTREKNIKINNKKWLILSTTFVFILSMFLITYVLYSEWGIKRGITLYADGVQGRYFTALLILLMPLFIWVQKFIKIVSKSDKTILFTIAASQIVLLCFYVFYTLR